MYIILNQAGEKMAYIQNMMILDASQSQVLGILIGDCFFGKENAVVGKIFNDTAYLLNGEIAGKVVQNKEYKNMAPQNGHMSAAWDYLSNIKEHTSTWIVETKKWSKKSFLDHLS